MKRKFLNFSLMASCGLLLFGVVGCTNGSFEAPSIRLDSDNLTMNVGETRQLKVSVPKEYASADVRWFTSNDTVAYFRNPAVGMVTAVGEGSATVTAAVAGAYAECAITVISDGGDPEAARFSLQSSASTTIGNSVKLSYSVNPAGSTLTFSSSDKSVADVDNTGTVTGIAKGEAIITGVCSNGLTRTCTVTVKEEGGGGGGSGEDLDIGVPSDLKLKGSLIVGSPEKSTATMQALIKAFKEKTKSTIDIQIKPFEDGDGVSNFPTGAASGPDVFPFVSDQTMSLNSLGALAPLKRSDYYGSTDKETGEFVPGYQSTMLEGAIDAATWNGNRLGYPFAADNGVVMFYDLSKVVVPNDPEQTEINKKCLETVDGLFELAYRTGTKVAFNVTNGFYAASILHTYNQGVSMFNITSTSTSYSCSSSFNSPNGVKGMELAYKIMNKGTLWTSSVGSAPSTNNILATIVDTSNVREYKKVMGSKYAVAPVPYVDESHTERICTYLGYKFYGVNNSITDNTKKENAHYFAKFLVSEYAQNLRFKEEQNQPTLKTLQSICSEEPHIAALMQQKASGSTLLLSVFGDEYFNNTSLCITRLLNDFIAMDEPAGTQDMKDLLDELDNSWQS